MFFVAVLFALLAGLPATAPPDTSETVAYVGGMVWDGEEFAARSLFVRGGASDYVEDSDLPAIRALFPAAELVTIEGAGHWVHAEKPDALADAVIDFLLRGKGE